MKKIILTTLWVVLACALPKIGKAQDTSTIDKLLTYMIAPLNKSQIPTQYLAEKGTIYLGMNTFNGTLSDSNDIEINLWRLLYFQLQTSYCQNGLLEFNPTNNKVYDVRGRTQSPYNTQYLFAAAPLNANNFTNTAMRFDNFLKVVKSFIETTYRHC